MSSSLRSFYSLLYFTFVCFLCAACNTKPPLEERIKEFNALQPKDPFLKAYYDYLKANDMVRSIFLYEEQLLNEHNLENASPEAFKDYLKYVNTLKYDKFNERCNVLDTTDSNKLSRIRGITNSPAYSAYFKKAEKDLKNASYAFHIQYSFLMSGAPDIPLFIKSLLEQDDINEETHYFYLFMIMPAKRCGVFPN